MVPVPVELVICDAAAADGDAGDARGDARPAELVRVTVHVRTVRLARGAMARDAETLSQPERAEHSSM